ncbi:golgin candidate 1 isoform X2 [Cornus florida]|uniref:golgin candidate 1 isoform X2 n=1 Tax=Cornus florida TaxID=4283 RepID=UPI0028A01FA0|nr:golgin candidate 1 isoform X2 [Cornus florida]
MSYFLNLAEDLFETVDRRAKSVVGDKPDEETNFLPTASNGHGSQEKRTRLKTKTQKRLSSNETPKTINAARDETTFETTKLGLVSDKDMTAMSIETDGASPSNYTSQSRNEEPNNLHKDGSILGSPLPLNFSNDGVKHDDDHAKVPATVSNVEAITSSSNGKSVDKQASDVHEESHSSPLAKGDKVVGEDPAVDSGQVIKLEDASAPVKIDEERSQSVIAETPGNVESELKDANLMAEPLSNQKKQYEQKTDIFPVKVQDQLDEAQGLIKGAISTGQSKEARLARVCAGLSSRLQEVKSENAQLEELLVAEKERSTSLEARIKKLREDLSASKSEMVRVESNMAEALAAKNSEIEALVSSMDALKKQAALSEGSLASMQANMESMMRHRELTETRMMQALREELASAERRAEEERAAHNATKMATMEREVELEQRAIEASTALARTQRTADERTAKATELEQKVALLEVECASLNQELQDMEARARRVQKKSPDEANQVIQAWQEEVERARQGQRDAESKLSSLEAEVQKMRVEMAAMKRDAEHYSRQEHMELEQRYRELTDLLYYKQTQLETMASEKAAAEFQVEKEIKRLQEAQVEAERSRVSRRASSSSWEEDTDIKSLDNCRSLPLYHRHMVGASIQLQKAAKLLDSGAVRATRFLWRYPIARVLLLFYLVFVHLFLMYLLHRLQEQADDFASREVAASMGLANRTLP